MTPTICIAARTKKFIDSIEQIYDEMQLHLTYFIVFLTRLYNNKLWPHRVNKNFKCWEFNSNELYFGRY